jgi:hypothetical protein
MRIILIAGFGEDESIFEKIQDKLPGDKLFLSLWELLPNESIKTLNAAVFARELTERFKISKADFVIGHSAGGWVALHIKNVVGCPIVQISSWSDKRKVIVPVRNRHIIYLAARTGLFLNDFVLRLIAKKYYGDKPSEEIFKAVFAKLIEGNRANVINQLRLIFNPYPGRLAVQPDLSIHARKDKIVSFPDGPVHEVAGDHFSLYTYPEQVYPPVVKLIERTAKEYFRN